MATTRIPAHCATLGEAIRFLRQKRGLTLRALAREVGVSAPFLSDIEHNRRSTDKIAEFAKVLGVSVKALEKRNTHLSSELRGWLQEKPEMVRLLRDIRESRKTADELRASLKLNRS